MEKLKEELEEKEQIRKENAKARVQGGQPEYKKGAY